MDTQLLEIVKKNVNFKFDQETLDYIYEDIRDCPPKVHQILFNLVSGRKEFSLVEENSLGENILGSTQREIFDGKLKRAFYMNVFTKFQKFPRGEFIYDVYDGLVSAIRVYLESEEASLNRSNRVSAVTNDAIGLLEAKSWSLAKHLEKHGLCDVGRKKLSIVPELLLMFPTLQQHISCLEGIIGELYAVEA